MTNQNEYPRRTPLESTRPALIDLVSRHEAAAGAGGIFREESDLLAALQDIIRRGQPPEARLFEVYHGVGRDMPGRNLSELD